MDSYLQFYDLGMEAQVSELEAELCKLKKGEVDLNDPDLVTPELEKLRTENSKLKYQLTHLQRSLAMEEARGGCHMPNILDQLESVFSKAISAAYQDLERPPVMITPSTQEKFGDYQCNSAMALSGLLKAKGINTNPRQVAQAIISSIPSSECIDKVAIAGPGFINIHLKRDYVCQELSNLVTNGVQPPNLAAKKRVLIDISTIIGDCIANLCEFAGHEVLKVNHVGDWGTQFGMLIAHLREKFPNYLQSPPAIADLQSFYKESKTRFDEEPEFKKRAYEAVVKLQSYTPEYVKAWNLICEVSCAEFSKVYERLDIRNLIIKGESFYQPFMAKVVKELEQKGMVEEDDGRRIVFTQGQKVPLTIVKSDGGYTYDTSDLAALRYRLYEDKADWILYIVDAVHFDVFCAVAADAGWYDPDTTRVEHIGFGVVLGEDK
ncbi:hypothetical protein LSH36_53g02001 [Paralvinella palmiformis]|uniref:arginine--tRNA ligase n=1 Tax=Paralvinella palmiformis TaxID=53620 RepID=A0AAD9K729_9ANNE|nr:hypothetical protein LSH36_53g02001 [Paralvinella palmiformis]